MTCKNCKYFDLSFYDNPCDICCCNQCVPWSFCSRMNFFTPIREHNYHKRTGGMTNRVSCAKPKIDVRMAKSLMSNSRRKMNMSKIKLKPCPFCGSTKLKIESKRPVVGINLDKNQHNERELCESQVTEAWNRRKDNG